MSDLPFVLPERPSVTGIRQRHARELKCGGGNRTQPMKGFEDRSIDIVDYIVRITDEIWLDRAVGYIYDTYAHDCAVYSSSGVVRSVEEVVSSTLLTLNAFPEGEMHYLNVAWSIDEEAGFYTSHLGHSRSTQVGRTAWGAPAWVRSARGCAAHRRDDQPRAFPRLPRYTNDGQTPRARLDLDSRTVDGWARALFHDIWNLRRLDWLARHYTPDVTAHAGGGRVTQGLRNYQALLLHVMTALPDGVMRVEHVSWADECDGVIVAVRWVLEGPTQPGGVLGKAPPASRLL